ncbi:hypothetical protein BD311DRAFT_758137 [Dichomitus squalens]|uniref:Uncharacterized protein n=1 Tax=Dichomitus squalens TaxID=114155 RepID=A0A4Q9MQA0_9APHY|nr:hypothetical protein BD311DRAFT_758137 [Dichomitus squalens]
MLIVRFVGCGLGVSRAGSYAHVYKECDKSNPMEQYRSATIGQLNANLLRMWCFEVSVTLAKPRNRSVPFFHKVMLSFATIPAAAAFRDHTEADTEKVRIENRAPAIRKTSQLSLASHEQNASTSSLVSVTALNRPVNLRQCLGFSPRSATRQDWSVPLLAAFLGF